MEKTAGVAAIPAAAPSQYESLLLQSNGDIVVTYDVDNSSKTFVCVLGRGGGTLVGSRAGPAGFACRSCRCRVIAFRTLRVLRLRRCWSLERSRRTGRTHRSCRPCRP